ncbi:hypothetical protein CGG93_00100 [Vibrio parahaemolyticus]|uniref:hypothetical protein n=1 Tax=Vibrio parahaemolyticus TaxID=670 RepID=UPI000A374278|nr:hypothetical protein [Vibrio parahaemolyticus]MBE3722900.1 hypothetical protein [Vibrio parahaemolyticus]MBE3953602.1 hypothetical protein [Vibrio parahaemolyticus]MBE4199922.1 hypothetical protein [Vibrio parahaemolyticus]MBE4484589.1 hypothetical protein [Vibrio parahaemolyticus]MBE5127347.1 hypothetical protein [Vibrio parahaemolyticus]
MSEKCKPFTAVLVTYQCDDEQCKGDVVRLGKVRIGNEFAHRCEKCSKGYMLEKEYPHLAHQSHKY